MSYEPENSTDRLALATRIEVTLTKAGFYEEWHGDADGRNRDAGDITKERTFSRPIEDVPDIRIVVYTSIVGDRVRPAGTDAIRVIALYRMRNGTDRAVKKESRVHRTGEIPAICERMLERARSVWRAAFEVPRCGQCGAPLFRSKKGNMVCMEVCWERR